MAPWNAIRRPRPVRNRQARRRRGDAEPSRGQQPIIPLLADRLGARMTGRFALTGERFDAATARAIGLVHETCPASDLETAGGRVVEHLLLAGPEAVAITKLLIEEAVETPFT